MTSSEKRVGKLEERLRHWGARLDELTTKADEIDADAKVDYHARLDAFRAKHRAAQLILADFKKTESEKWDQFKTGIERSWSELESAFRELKHPSKH